MIFSRASARQWPRRRAANPRASGGGPASHGAVEMHQRT
jgi:hypothetical protein